ncbi:MAG: undecaprenyl-diphosphate phosphatase [Gemmatimonadetes bacterium]|nr:undecaprenyl-diphosphate phosphatase [Gemmatimonadota bacterium]
MTWWEATILGVIQGLTEFFPVSSSGHLVIGQELLGLSLPGILFDVVVHVATLISVLVVYREKVLRLIQGALGMAEESTWPYILKVVLATIPVVIVGGLFKDWFEARFDDPVFVGTMLLVTGAVVWSSRWALGTHRPGPLELLPLALAALFSAFVGTVIPFLAVLALQVAVMSISRLTAPRQGDHAEPTWGGALLMGVAQAIAIFPGITRSGSTVVAGLWRRIDPVAAAEFSFLMSIPAILGAAVLQVPDALRAPIPVSAAALIAGFLAAAISGVLAIRFFVALLRKQNFYVFAIYVWAAGALFLLTQVRA